MCSIDWTAVAAWVQAIAAITLIGVTYWYVRLTRDISNASGATVRAMREQQLTASQPLISGQVEIDPPGAQSVELGAGNIVKAMAGTSEYTVANTLKVLLENVGNGPALEVGATLTWGDIQFEPPSRLAYLTTNAPKTLVLTTKQFSGPGNISKGGPPFVLSSTYEDIYHRRFIATATYSLDPAIGLSFLHFAVAYRVELAAGVNLAAEVEKEGPSPSAT